MSGAAAGCPEGGHPRRTGTMHPAMALPGNAQTILTHLFGRGLEDDRYVVKRFQAMADGDIRRITASHPS